MELREALELVDVAYESDNKKVVMTFLDEERGQIRVVNFNKQAFKDGKYVDDAEKAKQVDDWCKDIFNSKFEKLSEKIGVKKDVYCYDNFNSLWECQQIAKFSSDMKGQMYQTTIKEILVDDIAIRIRYEIKGNDYESKMTYATYMESMKKWFEDPQKKKKQLEKFESKFLVPVSEKDSLIGKTIMIEVKSAFGNSLYGEIKNLPRE